MAIAAETEALSEGGAIPIASLMRTSYRTGCGCALREWDDDWIGEKMMPITRPADTKKPARADPAGFALPLRDAVK